MNKFYNILALILLICAILCLLYNKEFSKRTDGISLNNLLKIHLAAPDDYKQPISQEKSYVPAVSDSGDIIIPVNRPLPFGGKTKAEVYKIRKQFVETSIFKNQNYEPSEDVFGQIADKKPWISTYICHEYNNSPSETKGNSEESRFINNPTILLGLEYPFGFHDVTDYTFCDTDKSNLIPLSVKYNDSRKEITVKYQQLPFSTKNDHTFYQFNGINARDFGYKYVYLDKKNSTYDIEFSHPSNISKDVYELYNFIHLGYACGVEGGCNNGSPRQEFLEFKNNEPQLGTITLKLWKKRPKSPNAAPDLTEKIIFVARDTRLKDGLVLEYEME